MPLIPNCRFWCETKDGNPEGLSLYLRHYSSRKANRASKGSYGALKLFVGPGRKMVLISPKGDAVFAWRISEFRKDCQTGIECTIFRNETTIRSSDMILEAEALAWAKWGPHRLFTMVDPSAVQSKNPGYCFLKAGWQRCGRSATGLHVFQKFPIATE